MPDRLTIVSMDDFSLQPGINANLNSDPLLQSLSQWPWPRRIHAALHEANNVTALEDLTTENGITTTSQAILQKQSLLAPV